MSSFEAAVPKTRVAEPKMITVATANAFPTAETRRNKGLEVRQTFQTLKSFTKSDKFSALFPDKQEQKDNVPIAIQTVRWIHSVQLDAKEGSENRAHQYCDLLDKITLQCSKKIDFQVSKEEKRTYCVEALHQQLSIVQDLHECRICLSSIH